MLLNQQQKNKERSKQAAKEEKGEKKKKFISASRLRDKIESASRAKMIRAWIAQDFLTLSHWPQKQKYVFSQLFSPRHIIGVKNAPIRHSSYRSDLDKKWFKENGELDWPKNDGFAEPPKRQTLKKGETIDRFSSKTGTKDRGNFLSPADTSYSDRALPYDASKMKHAKYEVIKDFDVDSGKAAPWFGENGGGVQYKTDISVRDLIKQGVLREVK